MYTPDARAGCLYPSSFCTTTLKSMCAHTHPFHTNVVHLGRRTQNQTGVGIKGRGRDRGRGRGRGRDAGERTKNRHKASPVKGFICRPGIRGIAVAFVFAFAFASIFLIGVDKGRLPRELQTLRGLL